MTAIEIALLIIGIIAFVASFRVPAGQDEKLTSEQQKAGEEEIRNLVALEMADVKEKISEMVDETVNYSVEKTERSLDRLTNEKIMAINEYSDTVLADIHKNHEEVIFLYDMLNDKQVHLKNTVKEVEQTAKSVSKTVQEAKEAVIDMEAVQSQLPAADTAKTEGSAMAETEDKDAFHAFVIPRAESSDKVEENTVPRTEEPEKAKTRRKTVAKTAPKTEPKAAPGKQTRRSTPELKAEPLILSADTADGTDERNNNEQILKLHQAGKSNMAIAKELGLGVGEVKLVIDLFKG